MATYITIPNATPEAEETLQPKTSAKFDRLTGVAAASCVLAMLVAAIVLTSAAGGEKAPSPALVGEKANNCPSLNGGCYGIPYTLNTPNAVHYVQPDATCVNVLGDLGETRILIPYHNGIAVSCARITVQSTGKLAS